MESEEIVVGWTTVETPEEADRLAKGLLRERLAACVQVDAPMRSHYRWSGNACVDSEIRIWIKTTSGMVGGIGAFFDTAHPYEVPQWVWTTASATAPYAGWVAEMTRKNDSA